LIRAAPRFFASIFAGGPMLAALLLWAYAPAWPGPFVFDDEPAIARAAEIVRTGDPALAFHPGNDAGETASGRPVFTLSLALNHALGGDTPAVYRAVNLLVHGLAALTLFGLIRRTLLHERWPPAVRTDAPILAAAIAALWALHPLHTTAVSYVAQRAEALAGLFLLVTLWAFARSLGSPRGSRWRTLSVICCLLGMATKETMAVAPLAVLLYDRTFAAGSFRAALSARRIYYLLLAATWLPLLLLVAGTGGRGGTAGFDTTVGVGAYLSTQVYAISCYLGLIAWPHPLVFDYGTATIGDAARLFPAGAILLLVAAGTVWSLRRGRLWGPLGVGFFLLLAPSSSIVPVASQTMAEHRVYLASVAPLVAAITLAYAACGRAFIPVCLAAILAAAGLTHARNRVYRSERALWADTVAKRPDNARAHHNLGLAEFRRGEIAAAAAHFERALALEPTAADALHNLGLCRLRQGRPGDALPLLERALAAQPGHREAPLALGNALLALGRPAEAHAHYLNAARRQPDRPEPAANLADVALRLNDPESAWRHAQDALRLRPDFAEAHLHAGNAAATLRRFPDARAAYEAAARFAPADPRPHNNLGNVLLELDLPDEAVLRYEKAIALAPEFPDPRRNLALLLLHTGRPRAALPHLEWLVARFPADAALADALRTARAAAR
jgi:tetratricopeptide (TPR) repeat protein